MSRSDRNCLNCGHCVGVDDDDDDYAYTFYCAKRLHPEAPFHVDLGVGEPDKRLKQAVHCEGWNDKGGLWVGGGCKDDLEPDEIMLLHGLGIHL